MSVYGYLPASPQAKGSTTSHQFVSFSNQGHQVIVGSPSKVAKGTLIEFARELTERIRVNQGWRGVHVIVAARKFRELPALGEPRHVEGNLTAWIV